MEQELTAKILLLFFGAIGLTGIVILIFCLRHEKDNTFDWKSFERYIKMMHNQTNQNLDILSKMNKQKDKIEKKIRTKRKKLGMSLVNKRR